jgi:hypothetical protein
MKTLIVILCATLIMLSGCKGKEERQPVTGAPQTTGEERKDASQPGGISAPEKGEGEAESGSLNTPPKITSLKISPEMPVPGNTITVTAETFDKEGDDVTVTYHWTKNGQPLSDTAGSLKLTEEFKRGDKITLTAEPDDGKNKGNYISLTVLVANTLPEIKTSANIFKFDGDVYSYQIKAIDKDGDALTYSLKKAPAGMTIDPSTGLIHWDVPPDFKGSVPVTISVTDGHRGEGLQSFTLKIRE